MIPGIQLVSISFGFNKPEYETEATAILGEPVPRLVPGTSER
jgi:hypothetical protein